MTSAEFSPAPFAVPNAVVPGTTLPDLEYTLYQPQQLKSRVPALMIHGFATRAQLAAPRAPPAGSANTCAPDTPC